MKKSKKIRYWLSIFVFLSAIVISFTNQTIDYFGKLGIQLSPQQSANTALLLAFISLGWVLWEFLDKK